jgi:hypothetical protein
MLGEEFSKHISAYLTTADFIKQCIKTFTPVSLTSHNKKLLQNVDIP